MRFAYHEMDKEIRLLKYETYFFVACFQNIFRRQKEVTRGNVSLERRYEFYSKEYCMHMRSGMSIKETVDSLELGIEAMEMNMVSYFKI